MYIDSTMKQRIVYIILTFVVFIAGYSIYTIISQHGKIKVTVATWPEYASVKIDGNVSSSGDIYLTPGKHAFEVSAKGFRTSNRDITVSSSRDYVGILTSPETEEAIRWANEPKNLSSAQTISALDTKSKSDAFRNKNPLLSKLPYSDTSGPFKIDYSLTSESRSFVTIGETSPDGRTNALRWIKQQGVDPKSIDIRLNKFSPPLRRSSL